MSDKRRILVHHPDPWGTGVECTFVYLPMWDGPLDNYTSNGWDAKYEDGTTATYDGECLVPASSKLSLETVRVEIIDFSL